MQFNVLGLDHKSAPLDSRSQFSIAYERLSAAYKDLHKKHPHTQCMILSTCNRLEVYYWGENTPALYDWLCDFKHLNNKDTHHHFYHHEKEKAINHVIRVATGLESMVMGEPEIFSQMKKAFARAQDYAKLGTELHQIFQRIFSAAKAIRSNTAIGHCPVSFGCTALRLLAEQPDGFNNAAVLLVGAGQTIQLVAKHLESAGVHNIHIINRTLKRAQCIAEQHNASHHELSSLTKILPQCDIVISAINTDKPIISLTNIKDALNKRNNKSMIFLDMGVPRNIDEQAQTLEHVTLYCVDDIETLVQHNTLHRTRAAIEAQSFIDQYVCDIHNELNAKDDVDELVKAMRYNTQQIADTQLNKALSLLEKGHDPGEVIKQLTQNLTKQWLHQPSTQLNQASKSGNTDLVSLAKTLFLSDQY